MQEQGRHRHGKKRITGFPLLVAALLAMCLLGCRSQPIPASPTAHEPAWSHWTQIDGRRVHYLDTCAGREGPALLVVHGFLSSSYLMRGLADGMSDQCRVVIPDLPGYGASEAPCGPVSMAFYLEFLVRFRAQVGLERFALAGTSMGANICTRYCLAHPDEVQALILISPFGLRDQAGQMSRIRRWDLLLPLACSLVSRRRVERMAHVWIRREELITPELVDSLWLPFTTREGRRVVVQTTRQILGARAMDQHLARVRQRVLVLIAGCDPLVDAESRQQLAGVIANGRLQLFKESGHLLALENPAGVSRAIVSFLEPPGKP